MTSIERLAQHYRALNCAHLAAALPKVLSAALLKFDLLIIDELGYLPMNRQGIYNLFQLINGLL